MTDTERHLRTAGIALLLAFAGSSALLLISPFDTGQRGFAKGALDTTALIQLVWVPVAAVLGLARWRVLSKIFWVLLLLNSLAVIWFLRVRYP